MFDVDLIYLLAVLTPRVSALRVDVDLIIFLAFFDPLLFLHAMLVLVYLLEFLTPCVSAPHIVLTTLFIF